MSDTARDPYGDDIYSESDGDVDTLANLGPLAPLAGVWEGTKGVDEHPVVVGTLTEEFVERYELQPIDRQTNGPQLFYGLRYHTHIVRPGERETFHDQVGYWLWEPEDSRITMTMSIPRAQVLMASGRAERDAREFEVEATLASDTYGILSNPFLARAFRTTSFRMVVTINDDGTWSYEETSVLEISGRDEPYAHVDRNTLKRIAEPSLNPMAREVGTTSRAKRLRT